jgi:predicted DNA binding CopG/RHH family protein
MRKIFRQQKYFKGGDGPLSIRFNKKLIERVKEVSSKHGLSTSGLVRRIVDEFISSYDKKGEKCH